MKRFFVPYFPLLLMFFVFQNTIGQDLPQMCGGSKVRYGISGKVNSVYEWELTGGEILKDYNDSIDILWDNNEGIHTIKVLAHSSGGCVSAPVYGYVLVTHTNSLFTDKTVVACEGDFFLLKPNSSIESIHWNNGSSDTSILINQAGRYSAEAVLSTGCKAKDTVLLVVQPKPIFSLGNDTSLCGDQVMLIDPGIIAETYEWSTGETTPTIEVEAGSGMVWAKLSGINGCAFTDTVFISPCKPPSRNSNIPNAFTPNNDNDNDTWRIEYLDKYPDASVAIYNRWGQLVFKTENKYPAEGWDGTFNGKSLPMSTYFYVIDLKDGTPPIVGSINLIR